MRPQTRKATFLGEAAFGFAISLTAAAIALTLSFVLPATFVARLVVAGLGLTLVVRAVSRSDEKTGRIVTLAVWAAIAVGIWLLGVGLPIYIVVHVTLAWLARSLFTYSRLIEAGIDLALSLIALSFAIFAVVRTDSVFLAAWSFVLVQAFHACIPSLAARWVAPQERSLPVGDPNRGFADAFKAADDALHRIAGRG